MENVSLQSGVQYYPLTHPQKRIWYLEKTYPDQPLHNIGGTVRMKEAIQFDCLEEAIQWFIQQHNGMRLRLTESDGFVQQYVAEYQRSPLRFYDFSGSPRPEEELTRWVSLEAAKPFPLYDYPLYELVMFKLGENEGGYLIKTHHLISDGWSMNILTQQICTSYRKRLAGEILTDEIQESYTSYIEQEQKYLSSERFLKNKHFWNEKFASLPERSQHARFICGEGKRKTFVLPTEQSTRIKEWASHYQTTPFTFFALLYLIYLHKRTRQEDLVIGMPLLNRSGKKEKSMVGMFTSTMPFRFELSPEVSVAHLVELIGSELKRCYYHQKYPFDLLIKDLELSKKGHDHLLNTCINFYNTELTKEFTGATIENTEFYNGKQLYSLQLIIREWSNSGDFQLDIDYKVEDYSVEQIKQMFRALIHLTEQMLENPAQKISELTLLSEAEKRKLIVDFNATERAYPREKSVVQLFEEQVVKTPNKVAIRLGDHQLTYQQVNARANQLARVLQQNHLEKGMIVGISTTHSLETIIGCLAVLKAGGAYLPIDPDYPWDRKEHMLHDSGLGMMLINKGTASTPMRVDKVIDLDDPELYSGEASNLDVPSLPTDLAYIIYTSGSTGKPKGTMVEHGGLVNYSTWAVEQYIGSSNTEVFPLYSSLSFDLTVTSIFPPLISGNEIIVYPPDEEEYVLYKILRENKATIIKLTPSHLSLLKEGEKVASSIKTWIVGGEELTVALAQAIHDRFGDESRIFNEYGPTEATVACMIHLYDRKKDQGVSVPIGIPATNTKIYVLDDERQPVPTGEVGELYISGDGVAKGYLNQKELTEERFIPDPFASGLRMYKTGDLARFVDCNYVEYVGRADAQVKIRGYRIEPGEIEQALLTHPCMKDAVVVIQTSKGDTPFLCAYYTEKYKIAPSLLQGYLQGLLPEYMIPTFFIALQSIPLTINGKVDRDQLPKPKPEAMQSVQEITASRDSQTNDQEELLLAIIQEVLNLADVRITDNFYHLGGDSIKAIQIQSKASLTGHKIKVKDILSHPIISEMALYLESREDRDSAKGQPCAGPIATLPAPAWFFSQHLREGNHYTQSMLLKVMGEVDRDMLETAINLVVRHHDAFRFNVYPQTEELYYNASHLTQKIALESIDLSGFSIVDQRKQLAQIGEKIKASFNIEEDILFKAALFHLGDQGDRLLLTAHHLAVDGVSWRIILEDFFRLVEQMSSDEQVVLPGKTDSVQSWATALDEFSQDGAFLHKAYWEMVDSWEPVAWGDADYGEKLVADCEEFTRSLTVAETEQLLLTAPDAYRTKADELMIMALALAMKDQQQSNEVIIELEGHGREEIGVDLDLSRTVGWFTSFYPIRLAIEGEETSSQIKGLKEQLRQVPHNGLSYGVLKTIAGSLPKDLRRNVRFNYLGDFSASFIHKGFALAEESSGRESSRHNTMTCLLDIVAYSVNQRLHFVFTYSKREFKQETVIRFVESYLQHLKQLIQHCCERKQPEFTPSDFETTALSSEELDSIFED